MQAFRCPLRISVEFLSVGRKMDSNIRAIVQKGCVRVGARERQRMGGGGRRTDGLGWREEGREERVLRDRIIKKKNISFVRTTVLLTGISLLAARLHRC